VVWRRTSRWRSSRGSSAQTCVIHSATNVGTGKGAELSTYIVEKGKPLLTMVK